MTNISDDLKRYLPGQLIDLLGEIGKIAIEWGESAYLVGGVVRDVLLEQPNLDVDIVIEGNAILLARRLAKIRDLEVKTHPRFGTAKLWGKDISVDIATARSETYIRPGALPTVKPATILEDLARRDFTVNAMATCLNPGSFGEILDPLNGREDMDRKLIRVLHPDSFSDDPTRIFRALRYEQRLSFQLEPETESQLKMQLDKLDLVSGERLWCELDLILNEQYPEKVFECAFQLGALQKLGTMLKGDIWLTDKFFIARGIYNNESSFRSTGLLLLTWRLTEKETREFIARLRVPGWAARLLQDSLKLKSILPTFEKPEFRPSIIHSKLKRMHPEVIGAVAIATGSLRVKKHFDLYLDKLRFVELSLNGDDLLSMGVTKGQMVGQILRTLHDAKLDQKIYSHDEELELARRLLSESESNTKGIAD